MLRDPEDNLPRSSSFGTNNEPAVPAYQSNTHIPNPQNPQIAKFFYSFFHIELRESGIEIYPPSAESIKNAVTRTPNTEKNKIFL